MLFCDLSNREGTVEMEAVAAQLSPGVFLKVEEKVLEPADAIYLWPPEVACCRD